MQRRPSGMGTIIVIGGLALALLAGAGLGVLAAGAAPSPSPVVVAPGGCVAEPLPHAEPLPDAEPITDAGPHPHADAEAHAETAQPGAPDRPLRIGRRREAARDRDHDRRPPRRPAAVRVQRGVRRVARARLRVASRATC